MIINLPRRPQPQLRLRRIRNEKGQYADGTCQLVDGDGFRHNLKLGGVIKFFRWENSKVSFSTWELWKLFIWSLFGIREIDHDDAW